MGTLSFDIKANWQAVVRMREEITKLEQALKNLDKSADVDIVRKMEQQLSTMRQQCRQTSVQVGDSFAQMGKSAKEVGNEFDALGNNIGSGTFKVGIQGFIKQFTLANIALKGFYAGIGALRSSISTIIDFQAANSTLGAITGSTADELEQLRQKALDLGRATVFTASQVTQLETELAKLGFNKDQILNMTEPILSFAQATGADLADAAYTAGSALRMFGAESTETTRYVAAMTMACNRSALDFGAISRNLATFGPVAKQMGMEVEDALAIFGSLRNAGIDAGTAATALRNIFNEMAGGKLTSQIGFTVNSIDTFSQALLKLKDNGYQGAEGIAMAMKSIGKRGGSQFLALLDRADELKGLRDQIKAGETEDFGKIADMMTNNVAGAIKILESAWEGFVLSFSQSTGPVKAVLDMASSGINKLTDMLTNNTGMMSADAFQGITEALSVLISALVIYKTEMGIVNKMSVTAYRNEAVALAQVMAGKQGVIAADLQEAVSKGRLTMAQAQLVNGLRLKAQAQLKALDIELATAQAELKTALALEAEATATERLVAAEMVKNQQQAVSTLQTQRDAVAMALDTASKTANTAATWSLKAAMDALGLSMLANPYVVAAVAIAGVGYAIYKLATAETQEEKARRQANEAWDEWQKRTEDHKNKVRDLINTVRDETASALQKAIAYKQLQQEMPEIADLYTQEQLAIADVTEVTKRMNEENDKINEKNLRDEVEKTANEIKKQEQAIEEYRAKVGIDAQTRASTIEEMREKVEKLTAELNKYKSELAQIEAINKELNKTDTERQVEFLESKESYETRKSIMEFYNKLGDAFNAKKLGVNIQADSNIDEVYNHIMARLKEIGDYPTSVHMKYEKTELEKIKSYIENSKTEWDVNGTTTIPFKFEIDKQAAKKAWEQVAWFKQQVEVGGTPDTSNESVQDQIKKAKADYKAAQAEMKRIKKEYGTQAEWDAAQEKLNSAKNTLSKYGVTMYEGEVSKGGKSKSQTENEKKRREESYKRARESSAKAFESIEERAVQAEINAIADEGERKRVQRDYENQKELEQIEKYKQEYIKKKTEELKAKAEAEGKKWNGKEYQLTSEESSAFGMWSFNTMVRQGNAMTQESIAKDEQATKNRLDYLMKFGTAQEKLNALTEQYNIALSKETDAFKRLALTKQYDKDKKDLNFELLKGDLDWEAITGDLDKVTSGKLKGQGNIISQMLASNPTLSPEGKKALGDILNNITKEVESRNIFQSALSAWKNQSPLDLLAGPISANIASVTTMMDSFGMDKDSEAYQRISNFTGGVQEVVGAAKSLAQGDVIGAIAGVTNAVGSLGDALFGQASMSNYTKAEESYKKLSRVWDDLIEKKKEYINMSWGTEVIKATEEAIALEQNKIAAAARSGKEYLNGGANWKSSSMGKRNASRITDDMRAQIAALGSDYAYALEGRLTGLFDLTSEQLETLRKEVPYLWEILDEEVTSHLDDIIKYGDSIDEMLKNEKEQLTGWSFEQMENEFKSTLANMDNDVSAFTGSFEDQLREAVTNSLMETFSPELEKIYEDMYTLIKSGTYNETQMSQLRNQYESLTKQAVELRDATFDALGIDTNANIEASRKSIANISQDTADSIDGRLTNIDYQSTARTAKLIELDANLIQTLQEVRAGNVIGDEIRTMIANAYLELKTISDNTGNNVKLVRAIESKMTEWDTHIKQL